MLRSIFALSIALVSASAFATPKVGDFAEYDAVFGLNGQTMNANIKIEITKFDESAKKYTKKQTVRMDSNPTDQSSEEVLSPEEMITDAVIDQVLANCAGQGGALQTITVPAGQFNTCALPVNNAEEEGTVWVAKVPFGMVQLSTKVKSDGRTITAALKSFK